MAKQVNGKLFDPNDPFPPVAYLAELLKSVDPTYELCPETFKEHYRPDKVFAEEFKEVLETGTSCGNPCLWAVLALEPNQAFPLHVHPNIEIAFIVKGVLYENLIANEMLDPKDYHHEGHTIVYDAWQNPNVEVHRYGLHELVLNKPGSVHQSFTKDEGVVLVCLFSGKWTLIDSNHEGIEKCLMEVSTKRLKP